MLPLPQPPSKISDRFDDWMFRLWKRIASTGTFAWSLIDKTGSNLTDLITRNHADLQNINTASYTHLSSTNATDLTDGGDTTLHTHKFPTESDVIDIGETLTILSNRQFIIAEKLTNNGTIMNDGKVFLI